MLEDGFEVLEWLRSQPFDDMVVVVFSGTGRIQNVEKAIPLSSDYFRDKKHNMFRQQNLVKLLEEYLSHK